MEERWESLTSWWPVSHYWRCGCHKGITIQPTGNFVVYRGASLVAQTVENLPAIQETQVHSLSWEDPLEKEMAIHSSILATPEFHRQRSLAGYSPWCCKEWDVTDWHFHFQVQSLGQSVGDADGPSHSEKTWLWPKWGVWILSGKAGKDAWKEISCSTFFFFFLISRNSDLTGFWNILSVE